MPLVINNEVIPVKKIANYMGSGDEVMIKLRDAHKELWEKFFSKGKPVVFRVHPRYLFRNSEGRIEGKSRVYIQYTEYLSTKSGGATVTYCENVVNKPGGVVEYLPKGGWFIKRETLDANQIEKALFFYAISSVTNGSTIEVYDEEQKETEIALSRQKSSELEFYIYSDRSPLADDVDKLVGIAYTWGVRDADQLPVNTLKNRLYTAVKNAEKDHVDELNVNSFIEAVHKNTPFMQAMIAIQRAIDNKSLIYKGFVWSVATGNRLSDFFQVPPHENEKSKVSLAYYLLANPKKFDFIDNLSGDLKPRSAPDEDGGGEPEVLTEEVLQGMKWPSIVDTAKKMDIKTSQTSKDDLIAKILAKQAIEAE